MRLSAKIPYHSIEQALSRIVMMIGNARIVNPFLNNIERILLRLQGERSVKALSTRRNMPLLGGHYPWVRYTPAIMTRPATVWPLVNVSPRSNQPKNTEKIGIRLTKEAALLAGTCLRP